SRSSRSPTTSVRGPPRASTACSSIRSTRPAPSRRPRTSSTPPRPRGAPRPAPVPPPSPRLRRGSVDAIVLRGLPFDDDPGPTPRKLGDTSSGPRRGHAWLAMCGRRLGHAFSYAKEKKGALVHHIPPPKEQAMTQSNASWQGDLSMHTENAFHPLR